MIIIIKVVLSISSSPGFAYSCIGGEKVRNVRCELPFSIVEYLFPLEKWFKYCCSNWGRLELSIL